MKLFVWVGQGVSPAYGEDGVFIVAAGSLEEARGLISDYLEHAPVLKVLSYTKEEAKSDWTAVTRRAEGIRQHNREELEKYYQRKGAVVMSRGMEPPGKWEGSCYSIDWNYMLSTEPDKVVDLDKPMIVACFYGYEG